MLEKTGRMDGWNRLEVEKSRRVVFIELLSVEPKLQHSYEYECTIDYLW